MRGGVRACVNLSECVKIRKKAAQLRSGSFLIIKWACVGSPEPWQLLENTLSVLGSEASRKCFIEGYRDLMVSD